MAKTISRLFYRIIACATCLLIMNSTAASAECEGQTFKAFSPSVAGESYTAAAIIGKNDAWVVGAISSEYATATATLAEHWDGAKWSAVITPSPGLAPNVMDSLNGVAAVATNDVWAVGQVEASAGNPQALIEHWNGTQWSVIPAPTFGNTSSLASVTATSSTNVWAAGSYQDSAGTHPLVEAWNGSSWALVPDPNPGALTSITAISPTDAWATANDIQHWNGTRWKVVSTLQGSSISAAGRVDVWAVVNVNQIAYWNGSVWTVTPSPPANLTGISADAFDNVWAVGQLNSQPFTEHWNGSSWSVIATPNVGKTGGLSAVALARSMALAVGTNANDGSEHEHEGLKLAWNGSAWTQTREPFTDSESNEFVRGSSTSSSDVWALDRIWLTGGSIERFDHWNGSDWSVSFVQPLLQDVADIGGSGPNDEWAVGTGVTCSGDQAFVVHWNGTKWDRAGLNFCGGVSSAFSSVAVVGPHEAWAVGIDVEPGCYGCQPVAYGLIAHKLDKSWTTETFYDGGNNSGFTAVRAVSASDVWAVGPYHVWSGTTTDYIFHYDGTGWTAQVIHPAERNTFLSALAISSPTDIWAVGGQSRSQQGPVSALMMHYDGTSWKEARHEPSPAGPLTSVVAVASNDVWAAGATYLAHWNGTDWRFIQLPPGSVVSEVGQIPGIEAMWEIGEHPSQYLNALALDKLIHCL